ncbi:MAG: Kdo domain containing protein [Flavobacterium sp.]|nr:Kdo domain containing protein [Flavobacterium sp.]
MKNLFSPYFQFLESEINVFINNYETTGTLFGDGKRNKIKLFDLDGKIINIKSFKKPNFYNQIIYKYLRKSKAQRSFEFANILLEKNIGTPQPIAFCENSSFLGIQESYYACEHLQCDLTFRELVEIPDFPEHAIILQQFMHFCFELHEKGVEFLDHSPGNTLIVKTGPGEYQFYLVDLNRMQFHDQMPFELRMKNLARLTPKKEMIEQMSVYYAKKYTSKSSDEINALLWLYTEKFQKAFFRKKRIKQRLFFWK